uniref:Uncharacterized protein n=1 Tax=Romanomermis culicivorax TaxID=13658 RepID=A0A915JUG9_ROMCU
MIGLTPCKSLLFEYTVKTLSGFCVILIVSFSSKNCRHSKGEKSFLARELQTNLIEHFFNCELWQILTQFSSNLPRKIGIFLVNRRIKRQKGFVLDENAFTRITKGSKE